MVILKCNANANNNNNNNNNINNDNLGQAHRGKLAPNQVHPIGPRRAGAYWPSAAMPSPVHQSSCPSSLGQGWPFEPHPAANKNPKLPLNLWQNIQGA